MATWQGLFVPPLVLRALSDVGFTSPMPIQSLALPAAIRDGKDIMGAAETGSGKTLAFGIPMLHHILQWKNIEEKMLAEHDVSDVIVTPLLGLVLTPTRELAVQVKSHMEAAAKYTGIKVAVIFGGMSKQKQQRILKKCPEIIIATPGRLWELIQMGERHLNLEDVKCLVIDEADRMVERGHFEELTKLLDLLNMNKEKARGRHTYLYSATLTLAPHKDHRGSKRKYPTEYNQIETLMSRVGVKTNAKIIDLTSKTLTAETLKETRINCANEEKDLYLYQFITQHPGRTLVFTNSKDSIRRLLSIFTLLGCNPHPLHAGMHQKQRLKNLERFTGNSNELLIATDVASRGLDIPDVQHVIHYQVPRSVEIYIHRSGRTARISKEGLSVMFVGNDDTRNYRNIMHHIAKGEDLPIFPVASNDLAKVKGCMELAKQIDIMEHRTQKMKRENDWFKKAAKEMDIELDDDSDLFHDLGKKNKQSQFSKQVKQMKVELAKMLKQPKDLPFFLERHPKHAGHWNDPVVPDEKGEAITKVKKKKLNADMQSKVSVKASIGCRNKRKEQYWRKRRVQPATK